MTSLNASQVRKIALQQGDEFFNLLLRVAKSFELQFKGHRVVKPRVDGNFGSSASNFASC
jgi:hypothetical protein